MQLSVEEKVRALRELTRGPDDCFAGHVISRKSGMARWRPVYGKLRDSTIVSHLRGDMEIGTYPMIPSPSWPRVYWICADFDGKEPGTDWQADVRTALECLVDAFDGLPVFVNLSRSGKGAHVRLLFRSSVPAWMARRWMTFWLEEAGIIRHDDDLHGHADRDPSFDRLIPPQDFLSTGTTFEGERRPGNLAGCPLNGAHARSHSGTLPLDPHRAVEGDYRPDGDHWRHVLSALEARQWGEEELADALREHVGEDALVEPSVHVAADGTMRRALPVVAGDDGEMQYMVDFCEFFRHMRQPDTQSYPLWVAMATELHRFGEAGRDMWHQLSALDPRYDQRDAEMKWSQTADMNPVRCDSLVGMGYRCPHLRDDPRCNGPKAPTYFANHANVEIL